MASSSGRASRGDQRLGASWRSHPAAPVWGAYRPLSAGYCGSRPGRWRAACAIAWVDSGEVSASQGRQAARRARTRSPCAAACHRMTHEARPRTPSAPHRRDQ